MEKSYFLSMTFNNIVFRGRNKDYGAYKLRKSYSKNVLLAATLATAIFSGALVGPLVKAMFFAKPVKYVKPVYEVMKPIDVILPPPPKKPVEKAVAPPPAPPEKTKVAQERFVEPRVVDDATKVTETMPDQQALAKADIGLKKVEGAIPDVPNVSLTEAPPTGLEGTGTEPSTSNEPFYNVEQMPQFKNGTKALMEYLSRKMRYPREAERNGVEGTVVVTFVVGVNGEISDVQVIKGLGYGTEEEAKRVVEQMPRWEPGRQNGRNVPVRFTLPIRFSIR
ncbi:energy transducer TonB [Pontibacter mangrovi]|uniref:TonB family protein n=1 Tax=Pontibacter mangrovi TaxID=2589816 RepID=A0A501W6J9_9BACT|nr:energy transducer TonB [Pontibacter mangrovi]TPE45209.1 TonB family protein [Pontibacter mangrovi]